MGTDWPVNSPNRSSSSLCTLCASIRHCGTIKAHIVSDSPGGIVTTLRVLRASFCEDGSQCVTSCVPYPKSVTKLLDSHPRSERGACGFVLTADSSPIPFFPTHRDWGEDTSKVGVAHVYVSPSQEKSTEFLGAHRRARNWSDQDLPLRNGASRPMIPASSRTTHPFAV